LLASPPQALAGGRRERAGADHSDNAQLEANWGKGARGDIVHQEYPLKQRQKFLLVAEFESQKLEQQVKELEEELRSKLPLLAS
jgi:hypothetical protein